MAMSFFKNKGFTYTKFVPRGTKVTVNYSIKVQGMVLKFVEQKRLKKAAGEGFFQWDDGPVQTFAVVTTLTEARQLRLMEHCLFLPDNAIGRLLHAL